ncbi:MAG: haloacid dehalogenase, partial [Nitrospinae bacterium]|nr:haloacid dehalogenase [Nitrospinota bacterium]
MLTKYKAVFFDVGGTLLRVHPSVGEVYAKHARPFGFDGSPEDLDRRFGMEWKRIGGMESLGTQSGLTAERKFWRGLVFNVFESCGGLRDFDAYFEIIYDAFQSGEHWRVYDDVAESGILDKLKERGTVLGVVSNWDSRLQTILQNTGLAP